MSNTNSSTAPSISDASAEAEEAFDITSPESREKRRERNLESFKKNYFSLYNGLIKFKPSSTLVVSEDGEPDIEFHQSRLYGGKGAFSHTREQLDSYWKTPNRVTFQRPSYASQDGATGWVLNDVFEAAKKEGITFTDHFTTDTAYYATVFGIGLGAHIDEIIERTNCRCLILFEPNLEFLAHSLYVYDWAGLIDRLTEEGKRLRFSISDNPDQINGTIRGTIRSINPCALDGMYMYFHYSNAVLKNGAKAFQKDLSVVLMGLGFFEDELAMISQSYRNLKGNKARIITDPHTSPDIPAFIIGGGPSLDQHIDLIKENKDKAVVIACGTSMEPLLKHGITPDFNILLERSELLLKAHQEAAEMFDLSKTTLLASSTIYPGIGELFGDVIYFFRGGLSSYPLFCRDESQWLKSCDPIVANGALAFTQLAGFKQTYFFGVDCGTKDAKRHHSKHSWYYDNRMTDYLHTFGTTIPANFGGTVMTNDVLLWSRDGLQNAIRGHGRGLRYYNCSDGARIDGAVPKQAATLDLAEPKKEKTEMVRDLVERFPFYTQEIFDESWDGTDLLGNIPDFADNLIDTVEKHDSLQDYAYHDDCNALLEPGKTTSPLAMLFRGTSFLALIAFEYFFRRMEDPEKAPQLEALFKEGFRDGVEAMRDESLKTFSELVERY